MSDEQRSELASKIMVMNPEGHTLSPRNQILVAMQLGNHATIVAGFRQWLAQGRCVRKGEHGACICVPCAKKEDPNQREGEIKANGDRTYFVSGTVFDISQTDLLPSEESETLATGNQSARDAGRTAGNSISLRPSAGRLAR